MAFTIVFDGDISKLDFNPMKAETVFGKVVAAGIGNAFDELEAALDDRTEPPFMLAGPVCTCGWPGELCCCNALRAPPAIISDDRPQE